MAKDLSKGTRNLRFMNRAAAPLPVHVATQSTSLLAFPLIQDLAAPLLSPHTGRNLLGQPPAVELPDEEPSTDKARGTKRKSTDPTNDYNLPSASSKGAKGQKFNAQVRRPPPSSSKPVQSVPPAFLKPKGFEDTPKKEYTGGNSATIVSAKDLGKKANRREQAKGSGMGDNVSRGKGKGKGKQGGVEPVWGAQGTEREWDAGKAEEDDEEREQEERELQAMLDKMGEDSSDEEEESSEDDEQIEIAASLLQKSAPSADAEAEDSSDEEARVDEAILATEMLQDVDEPSAPKKGKPPKGHSKAKGNAARAKKAAKKEAKRAKKSA